MNITLEDIKVIALAATSVVTAFSVIAKLTPTKVDNKIVIILLKIIDALALNNTPTQKKS